MIEEPNSTTSGDWEASDFDVPSEGEIADEPKSAAENIRSAAEKRGFRQASSGTSDSRLAIFTLMMFASTKMEIGNSSKLRPSEMCQQVQGAGEAKHWPDGLHSRHKAHQH
jgi:hypothetical protein